MHEAYVRLGRPRRGRHWNGRGHFFSDAATRAMRRILVEKARHNRRSKAGGGRRRVDLDDVPEEAEGPDVDLLALDEALTRLEAQDKGKADLVKLRYFAGLSIEEAAEALGISRATAVRHWHYAKVWLFTELGGEEGPGRIEEK